MSVNEFDSLVGTIQSNCDIADARHAREMTLCSYLLGMRELYCWERSLPPRVQPDRKLLGKWLRRREQMWDGLESLSFAEIALGTRRYDPFDAGIINAELLPRGLVYGAGYGNFHRPHFFLGALERSEQRAGLTVLVSGC